MGMFTVLSRPGTVLSSNSRSGQAPGRVEVLPSTTSLTAPTGAGASLNRPCGSVWAVSELSRMRSVAPGTGWPVLSSTTPLIEVPAGAPAALPDAGNGTVGQPG